MDERSNAKVEELDSEVDCAIFGTGIEPFIPLPLNKFVNACKYSSTSLTTGTGVITSSSVSQSLKSIVVEIL